jgi:hypothetical protein
MAALAVLDARREAKKEGEAVLGSVLEPLEEPTSPRPGLPIA